MSAAAMPAPGEPRHLGPEDFRDMKAGAVAHMTRPNQHPVDVLWLQMIAAREAELAALFAACEAIGGLVEAVLAAGSHLARPAQRELRRAAADGMAFLRLDRFERDGVRLTLAAAPMVAVDDEHVVVGPSRLRVSLDPLAARQRRLEAAMAAPGGTTIVDLLERRGRGRAA